MSVDSGAGADPAERRSDNYGVTSVIAKFAQVDEKSAMLPGDFSAGRMAIKVKECLLYVLNSESGMSFVGQTRGIDRNTNGVRTKPKPLCCSDSNEELAAKERNRASRRAQHLLDAIERENEQFFQPL